MIRRQSEELQQLAHQLGGRETAAAAASDANAHAAAAYLSEDEPVRAVALALLALRDEVRAVRLQQAGAAALSRAAALRVPEMLEALGAGGIIPPDPEAAN